MHACMRRCSLFRIVFRKLPDRSYILFDQYGIKESVGHLEGREGVKWELGLAYF